MNEIRNFLQHNGFKAILIPSTDEFLGEYTPPHRNFLRIITGFTGSNGLAIIGASDRQIFLTDGRYTEQARRELKDFEIYNFKDVKISDKLAEFGKIALDPRLHSVQFVKSLQNAGLELEILEESPLENFAETSQKMQQIYEYPLEFAGRLREDKMQDLQEFIKSQNADAYFIFDPHDVNWLLNIRGNELDYTPIANIHALVTPHKIYTLNASAPIKNTQNISLHELKTIIKDLQILLNPHCNFYLHEILKTHAKGLIVLDCNLVEQRRAIKNETEIEHARKAHFYDGLAVQEFINWLSKTPQTDEMEVARKLLEFRKKQPNFVSESFATIAGFNANGAIIHYHASPKTNAKITSNGLLLVDSGGQYLGATTDITRTIAIGTPTPEQKHHFTLVLKGHIDLASVRFKAGTTGSELDILARQFLWAEGLDYAHGTGHGVGSFLSVHEGPQSISPYSKVALKAGMILSNEPGFYKNEAYGIRIESLLLVIESPYEGFLEFETLTRVPIDEKLIVLELLTETEKSWLNWYNHDYCKLTGDTAL
jgi:Xaa-Pro aminopeptidase